MLHRSLGSQLGSDRYRRGNRVGLVCLIHAEDDIACRFRWRGEIQVDRFGSNANQSIVVGEACAVDRIVTPVARRRRINVKRDEIMARSFEVAHLMNAVAGAPKY